MKLFALVVLTLAGVGNAFGQADTLVSYDVRTGRVAVLPAAAPDSAVDFDSTGCSRGVEPGFSPLDLNPPQNSYLGSGSTYYMPAQDFFPVSDFPLRTAVKLFKYVNGVPSQCCSGMMVSKDLVLTAAHCVHYYFDSTYIASFRDSILAVPAFDDGRMDPELGESASEEYILPKVDLVYPITQDVALIKLRDPIGLKTGWIGIAFIESDSLLRSMVLQQLSYPGAADPSDSSRVFNGDTLYYSYGKPTDVFSEYIGYAGLDGIPGQSGSSLFYTNDSVYYSLGVQSFSYDAWHYRINREVFYALKSVIDEAATPVHVAQSGPTEYSLSNAFPNPFNPGTNIEFTIPKAGRVNLAVYDVLGRVVSRLIDGEKRPGTYRVRFDGSTLASGVYFYALEAGSFHEMKKMLLLK